MNKKIKKIIRIILPTTFVTLAMFICSCVVKNDNLNNQSKPPKKSNSEEINDINKYDKRQDDKYIETNDSEENQPLNKTKTNENSFQIKEKSKESNILLSNLSWTLEEKTPLSVNFDISLNNKEDKTNFFRLELIDNNKKTYLSQPSLINEKENKIKFNFNNVSSNREYHINRVISDHDKIVDFENNKKIIIEPSKTFIDPNSFFIDNISENMIKIGFLIKTNDNILNMVNDLKIKLFLDYEEKGEILQKEVVLKTTSNGNSLFVKSTISDLKENTEYKLNSAMFIDKPQSLLKNINDNENNIFYDKNLSTKKFEFKTTIKTTFFGKINLNTSELEIINDNTKTLKLNIDKFLINKNVVNINDISNQFQIIFNKINKFNRQKEEILAVNTKYSENLQTLLFEIPNFDFDFDYELKMIKVYENNLLTNQSSWKIVDLKNLDKKINLENYINDKFIIESINSKNLEDLNLHNILTINFANLKDYEISKLIEVMTSNNKLNKNNLYLKNYVIALVDKYFKLNEYKNSMIRLASKNDLEFDINNDYFFIKSNLTKINNNSTENNDKYSYENSNNEEILLVKNPYLSNNNQGIVVENSFFNVKRLSSQTLFAHNESNAHSYRIPSIIKTSNNVLIASADKRNDNWSDYNNSIEQVIKKSVDGGKSWSEPKKVVSVKIPKHGNAGIVIDGVIGEVMYQENNIPKSKLIFAFDLFPGKSGIPHLYPGNPWVLINNKPYLKMWTKTNNSFDQRVSVLKKEINSNWFRQYIIPTNNFNVNEEDLIPTNNYVDLNYHQDTKTITGIVYENVEKNDFLDKSILESKKTNHSVLDRTQEKYLLAINSHLLTLESYDEGETWRNLNWIESNFVEQRGNLYFLGTGVGNIIQLKNQTNSLLNNRIIMTTYAQNANKKWVLSYVYSDDFGNNWNYLDGFSNFTNSTESTMIQVEDGTLYWMTRVDIGYSNPSKYKIARSIDAGKTWTDLDGENQIPKEIRINDKRYDGNVFSGISSFSYKNKNYFVFALSSFRRNNGSLYIADDKFEQVIEVFKFNNTNNIPFSYSYPIVLNAKGNRIEVAIMYETPQFYKYNDLANKAMEEIQIDRFEIKIKE